MRAQVVVRFARQTSRILPVISSLTWAGLATAQPAQDVPQLPEPAPSERKPEPAPAEGSSALSVPETPPGPTVQTASPTVVPPPLPRTFPDEASLALRDPSTGEAVAGWHNFFFVRDPDGNFRISPTGDVQLDFHAWAGTGVNGDSPVNGGAGLHPRFFVRRFRVGMHGEFLKRWSFLGTFDLSLGVSNGSVEEQSTAQPSAEPGNGRFRPTQALDAPTGLRDLWVNYSLCPCLNLQLGQFQPPVTLENRTADGSTPLMERSLATRSFVVPGQRETGLQLWGDLGDDMFSYEIAVLGGDGQNRATVDSYPDVAGRFLVAPFKSSKLAKDIRFGVSGRHGERDQAAVAYDVFPFMSGQGFALWDSSYQDSAGNRVHIIPSGAQNTIGGEAYVPVGPVDIVAQAYYNAYNTREALAGFQLTNTERLGTLSGLGLTSWVTWWAFGDERVGSPAGRLKPNKLNLKKKAELKRGLELSALFSAIVASYDGNSRGGADDAETPGSLGNPATSINVYQAAASVSYWHTRGVRIAFNYSAYLTPGSGSDDNLSRVPGNLSATPDNGANLLHEFGSRLQLAY